MPKNHFFLTFFAVFRCLDLRKLLEILIADLVLVFHLRQYTITIFLSSNLSPLTVHLNPEIIPAIVLKIAFFPAAKWTEETRRISHSLWISLVVLFPVIRLLIKLLKQSPILFIFDVMLPLTIITIASAREITISNRCGHHYLCVIVLIKQIINF